MQDTNTRQVLLTKEEITKEIAEGISKDINEFSQKKVKVEITKKISEGISEFVQKKVKAKLATLPVPYKESNSDNEEFFLPSSTTSLHCKLVNSQKFWSRD